MILRWIDEAHAQGARLEAACAVLGLRERTVQRWRVQGPEGGDDQRQGPKTPPANALSSEERQRILTTLRSARFRDASPKTVVPTLADEGIFLGSEATFYRVLRAHGELTHRGRTKPRAPRPVPQHTARGRNQVWSWDITYLSTTVRGRFFFLYLIVDLWSRRIMGWTVQERECGEHAAAMVQQACREAKVERDTLILHADNGASMRGATLAVTLDKLGVRSSFSRPSVSDDNPYSEALFRTVKYVPWWPSQPFDTVEQARAWVERFVRWYNTEHLHSGIGFVTPQVRYDGQDAAQLSARRAVYERARQAHPTRWSGRVRSWAPSEEVSLNARPARREPPAGSDRTKGPRARTTRARRTDPRPLPQKSTPTSVPIDRAAQEVNHPVS
jgi:transposase InsO family protein